LQLFSIHLDYFTSSDWSRSRVHLEKINPGGRHLGLLLTIITEAVSALSALYPMVLASWLLSGAGLVVLTCGSAETKAYFRAFVPDRCAFICGAQSGTILPKQNGPVPQYSHARVC
jgi:hypothetical protein